MLAQLLASKPKSRLVSLFLAHPSRAFSFTELRVATKTPQKLLQSTLRELSKIGFLLVIGKDRNRYYKTDKHFALYPELVSMLRKIKKIPTDLLAKAAAKVGDTKFTALTGVFAGRPRIETDILFVGKVSPKRLKSFLRLAEKFAEREVSYSVFALNEFEYRKVMNDRFVKNILDNDPVIVVDRIKQRTLVKTGYKR